MARASNCYVVVEHDYGGDHVLAAFTVKHECKSWLRANPCTCLSRGVLRVPNGGGAPTLTISEEEFLK